MEPGQEDEEQVEKSDDPSRLSQEAEEIVVEVLYTPPGTRTRNLRIALLKYIAPREFLWTVFGMHPHAISTRARQPPKTRNGSAKSAAVSKLRTRARKNCEHALVELGGIEPPSVEG